MAIYDLHVNLNTGGLSALFTTGPRYGRLAAHSDTAIVTHAKFRVQKGGHARAVREKTRNVHAFVRGETVLHTDIYAYMANQGYRETDFVHVRYNPFDHDYFFRADNELPVTGADLVLLDKHYMLVLHPY